MFICNILVWPLLNTARIQKAQELLETTSLSFKAIVWQVGYQGSLSFNKIFTKTIGLTATEYQKRFKS